MEAINADKSVLGQPHQGRLLWSYLPMHVRDALEAIMGSAAVKVTSQNGGYSPGTADRIITEKGDRFFVKSVGTSINPFSPDILRKEITVMQSLPEYQFGAKIVDSYDDGEWVAVVFNDIDGRHPDLTDKHDRKLVSDALQLLISKPLSREACEKLPSLTDDVLMPFNGWKAIKDSPLTNNDEWVANNLNLLLTLSSTAASRLQGNFLVHSDLRKDNIMISGNQALIIDWPWAAHGAPWFDALTILIDAKVHDVSFDLVQGISSSPILSLVPDDDINSVTAGIAGYFLDSSRKPAPPGLDALRPFQFRQGMVALELLRTRI